MKCLGFAEENGQSRAEQLFIQIRPGIVSDLECSRSVIASPESRGVHFYDQIVQVKSKGKVNWNHEATHLFSGTEVPLVPHKILISPLD